VDLISEELHVALSPNIQKMRDCRGCSDCVAIIFDGTNCAHAEAGTYDVE
jgi:hypothetical protein